MKNLYLLSINISNLERKLFLFFAFVHPYFPILPQRLVRLNDSGPLWHFKHYVTNCRSRRKSMQALINLWSNFKYLGPLLAASLTFITGSLLTGSRNPGSNFGRLTSLFVLHKVHTKCKLCSQWGRKNWASSRL